MASKAPTIPPLSINRYKTEVEGRKINKNVANVRGVTLVFDGPTGLGDPHRNTYFGKRHLLRFAGGEAAAAGDVWRDKAKRVFGKRVAAQDNYGRKPFPANGRNTMVFIDRAGEEHLIDAFASAILDYTNNPYPGIPGAYEAFPWFGTECVYLLNNTGNVIYRGKGIEVAYVPTSDGYAIVHMGNRIYN